MSRLILLALCIATSAFNKFSKTPRSVLEIRMKNDFFRSRHDAESSQSIFIEATEKTPDITEPWTAKQLMAPAELAAIINDPNAKKPVIFCVGPGALIRGSLDMGPAKEKENLEKLKQQLKKLPRDTNVVIYCGC